MSELLLVRSGVSSRPVTKSCSVTREEVARVVRGKTLRYLGEELPVIGSTGRVPDYSDPEHVVLHIDSNATTDLAMDHCGYYLVADLRPSDVKMA